MRFGLAHKLTTYLAVLSAYLVLVLSGELPSVTSLVCLVGVAASWWWEPPRVDLERWSWLFTGLAVASFCYGALAFVSGGDLVVNGAELLLFLMVAKLFGRRTSRDYLQVYVLSFLMVVAATVLNGEVTFGVFFLGYVLASTWALILLNLRRDMEEHARVPHLSPADDAAALEGAARASELRLPAPARLLGSRRLVGPRFFAGTGAVSMVIFAGAAILFLFIPRIGFGLFFSKARSGLNMAGFSDDVRLGGHGVIKDDDTVVMRVEIDGPFSGRDAPYLHWRGVAYDEYSRGQWRRSRHAPTTAKRVSVSGSEVTHRLLYDRPRERSSRGLAGAVRQDIYLEPLGYDVLFGASMPGAFKVTTSYRERPRDERNDEIRRAHTTGIKYTVLSQPATPDPAVLRRAPRSLPPGYDVYLQLPPEITPRVRQLAARVVGGASTDYDRARALETYLQKNLSYTLEMQSPGALEPIDFFLFERRKGHCEYFSSAMTVMLRSVGVPARNVNGFLGGEWNEYDEYIAVRAGDAHSWVEVYFAGAGWVTFDPTPTAADRLGRGGDSLVDRLRRMADTVRFKWFKWVIEYDLERQVGMFKGIGDLFKGGAGGSVGGRWRDLRAWTSDHRAAAAGVIGAFAGIVVGIAAWRRRRRRAADPSAPRSRRARDPIALAYLGALRALGRGGWARPPSSTPREHALAVARAGGPGAAELTALAELYYAAEYGAVADGAARQRARELASSIDRAVRDDRRRRRWDRLRRRPRVSGAAARG